MVDFKYSYAPCAFRSSSSPWGECSTGELKSGEWKESETASYARGGGKTWSGARPPTPPPPLSPPHPSDPEPIIRGAYFMRNRPSVRSENSRVPPPL